MGVCCIVFDIDGMLFEFLKYWKQIKLNFLFFSIFHVFFAFHTISNIKKKFGVQKNFGGGGGGCWIFFFRKTILSHFTFYALKKNILKPPVCPSRLVYCLNGRWFLQIVDRDSLNLYPLYPLFPFFCMLEKCPFTYSCSLNGRWFLQIVDIGNFIMRLEILKSAPSLTG